jgi:hypothetical protein
MRLYFALPATGLAISGQYCVRHNDLSRIWFRIRNAIRGDFAPHDWRQPVWKALAGGAEAELDVKSDTEHDCPQEHYVRRHHHTDETGASYPAVPSSRIMGRPESTRVNSGAENELSASFLAWSRGGLDSKLNGHGVTYSHLE